MSTDENNAADNVQSPCIRNCCLNNDDICVGCFRHLDEITGWQNSSEVEKQKILQDCKQRKLTLTKT